MDFKEERILAIDFGEKRIGIAVSDPLNIFAYPLTTFNNNEQLKNELKKIITEYKVAKIILGNPIKESGEKSKLFSLIEEFKLMIEDEFKIQVEMIDERYTSEIAKQRIVEKVVSKKKRRDKSLLDMNAAAVLLEGYLDRQKYSSANG